MTQCVRSFVADQIFSQFTRTKGGGVAERWHDDKGEGGGVWLPPKIDDFIYEQPLNMAIFRPKNLFLLYPHIGKAL